ncbi:MAG TPA: serine/threonine-protein kinase [Gaiellaceae bacterium]|nr:serine/threonine-protein kinase [Gaiellaceae bacterium]
MTIRGDRLQKPSYAILRSLRGGNVGEAWLAQHEVFGQRVVQKTYSVLGLEDSIATREPRLLRNIDHRHVARVYEAQWDPDHDHAITFVMPYYEGGSIADAFDEGYRFSLHHAIAITEQVLDALAHVHTAHRYIHRDVKPGNVFLDGDRRTSYVGDFGSAAEMNAAGRVPAIEGSPLYMPPEGGPQDGEMSVTGDVYAVGLTLYEMLNGPFPYADISPEAVERRLARQQRALPDRAFEEWDPCVPDDLRRIVRKAMRQDAAERYQSCSDFITHLQRVRCIDWYRDGGQGLDGEWTGTWPPRERKEGRRRYRVTSAVLRGARRRLVAVEALPNSSWRRFGVSDATVSPEDVRAVERFFAEVATRAAHRAPAD